MSLNSGSKRLRNAPPTYVGNCAQSRQVGDVSWLSDFQVASEWPTSTGLPNNQRSIVLDFGEGVAHLDGPHVLDFEAGVVWKDVFRHSASANPMSHGFVPSYDEHPVQQLDVRPARTTCQTRALTGGIVGGPRSSSHTRSHVQPSATAATGRRSRVLGKRQYNHVSRGPVSTQSREFEADKRPELFTEAVLETTTPEIQQPESTAQKDQTMSTPVRQEAPADPEDKTITQPKKKAKAQLGQYNTSDNMSVTKL